jgi:8-amino-7-oxononanoate synthase
MSAEPDPALERELARELEEARAAGLLRELEPARAELPAALEAARDFLSNDTLGLARDPALLAAARAALEGGGARAGSGASRLLGGTQPAHEQLEQLAARWLGAPAALLLPSAYHANLAAVGALVGPGDEIYSDALCHASLVDAARLARARVFVHAHHELGELERQLARPSAARRRLVLCESIYSMDGDAAPLRELDALCARHRAWLLVDEAHAVGLLGREGAGAVAALAEDGHALARLAARTFGGGKALGCAGGLIVGSRELCAAVAQRARAFVYTTAPAPSLALVLSAAIERARAARAERARALAHARELARLLDRPAPAAAIVPWIVGSSTRATALAARVDAHGWRVRAVRPPSVPEGSARLRLVCRAGSEQSELEGLARELLAERAEHEHAQHVRARRAASSALAGTHAPLASGVATYDAPLASAIAMSDASLAHAIVVAGTGTGVGKTIVSALLLRAARARGSAQYWKPVQTGAESDTEVVARLAQAEPAELRAPLHALPLAASPHAAAAAAGCAIDPQQLSRELARLRGSGGAAQLVLELAGGLLVPWTLEGGGFMQLDWLARERLPLVLVASAGLGTLNHSLLALEALRARGLEPRALVLVGAPWLDNRAALERLAAVRSVIEVPHFDALEPAVLARWLEDSAQGAALAELLRG